MGDAYTAAGLLWFLIFVYAITGSVDFGATFWRMVYLWRRRPEAERVAERYVSALWETTNVFLVLIVVVLVGFFPQASYALGTVMLLPVSLILGLLALRGATLGFAYAGGRGARVLPYVSGATAVLLPALLVLALPISDGGFVSEVGGRLVLHMGALFSSPRAYAYLALGLSAGLFTSATFLADYAAMAGERVAHRTYRRMALVFGPVMMAAGLAALGVLPETPWLWARLITEWPWFLGSMACFALALLILAGSGPPRWAVVAVGLQFSLADIGYGSAHSQYMLYPMVPTAAAFSSNVMFHDLLWVTLIGLGVLIPGFIWLWRLFVTDPRYTQH